MIDIKKFIISNRHLLLNMHNVCNQTCVYCPSSANPEVDFGYIFDPPQKEKLLRYLTSIPRANIVLTGGEPLITPDLAGILEPILDQGHTISLQSNLRTASKTFTEIVPSEKCGWVMATFHSVAMPRFDHFLATAEELKNQGYSVAIKFILDETLVNAFTPLWDSAREKGIGCFLSPILRFENNRIFPIPYTKEHWRKIVPRMSMLSSWLFFAGGFHSVGRACSAGSHLSRLRCENGDLHGCAFGYPSLGNVMGGSLVDTETTVHCEKEVCACDFHHYTATIPSLSDADNFALVLSNQQRTVPFSEYEQWLSQAKATPQVDLKKFIQY